MSSAVTASPVFRMNAVSKLYRVSDIEVHALRGVSLELAAGVVRAVNALAQGSPVLVLGDPQKIERVADRLSSDAVRVKPGMAVEVAGWGGSPLPTRVRSVEPVAFTKVSALGVEERRVNVASDLEHAAPGLGDGYRIEARILVDQRPAVLVVPSGRYLARLRARSWPRGGP